MPNWSGGILTTKGQALQAKVDAGQTTLILTKMKIGSGTLPSGQNLQNLNDLVAPQMNVPISAVSAEGNISTITGVITNAGLTNGFNVRELGVFAQDPTLGEILYSITTDSAPDYLPPEGGAVTVSSEFNYHITVSNAANVTATLNPSGLVTVSILQQHKTASILDHPDNSVTDAKIGNRTITDTVTAAAGAGTITNLLSEIGNMIKRITGKSNWYTAPAITLEDAGNHVNATGAVHGAIDTNMATTLVMRNSSGNFAANIITAELNGNAKTATNATNHIAASSGAHAASAISSTATGDVSATNVQAAIAELASEKATTVYVDTYNAGQKSYSWSAIITCATWSRICYTPVPDTYGSAMLLRIAGTRGNVVFNHTFMITASHSHKGMITQLVSGNYTNYILRLVTGSNGQNYIEIYDAAQSATSSTTQTLFCYAKMLSTNGITTYTAFTDGTTLPESFLVSATLTTKSASIVSSGNIYIGDKAVATTDYFNYSTEITATDWNTLIVNGKYYVIGTSALAINGPLPAGDTNHLFYLDVINGTSSRTNYVSQQATNVVTGILYTRKNQGGTWSVWKQVPTNEASFTKALTAPTNRDLNNFKDLDSYWHYDTGGGAVLNTPYGTLANGSSRVGTVRNHGINAQRIFQYFDQYYPANTIETYRRAYWDSGWTPWVKIATTDLIPAGASAVKAHVNFSYEGGVITIRNSFNVSSVVRTSGGQYTINFAMPLASANYTVQCTAANLGTGVRQGLVTSEYMSAANTYGTKTTNAIAILTVTNNDSDTTVADVGSCNVTILQ